MMTNMDKLYEAVEARGPVCVGLDTDFSYLPEDFVDTALSKGENIVRFNKALIEATKAVAGCYKVQIAYYEALGLDGLRAYAETLRAVRAAGVPEDELLRALENCGLPTASPCGLDELCAAAMLDKKRRGGAVTLVLPEKIGKCALKRVPVAELREWFKRGMGETACA